MSNVCCYIFSKFCVDDSLFLNLLLSSFKSMCFVSYNFNTVLITEVNFKNTSVFIKNSEECADISKFTLYVCFFTIG